MAKVEAQIEVEILEQTIVQMKQKLVLLYQEKGSFGDDCVIALSQELDVLVVQSQKMRVKSFV